MMKWIEDVQNRSSDLVDEYMTAVVADKFYNLCDALRNAQKTNTGGKI